MKGCVLSGRFRFSAETKNVPDSVRRSKARQQKLASNTPPEPDRS